MTGNGDKKVQTTLAEFQLQVSQKWGNAVPLGKKWRNDVPPRSRQFKHCRCLYSSFWSESIRRCSCIKLFVEINVGLDGLTTRKYRVCQKVTPFWYPSFLPLLDALYIYNFWLLTDHFYRAMHVVLAWYCYRMLSVRPSVCLWRCCIYRVASFQKMKFGMRRQRRRDRDAVGVEGVRMGRGYPPPQPTRESGGAS